MPILKSLTAPNGVALGFHRATRLNVDLATGLTMVSAVSYVDEASYISGKPVSWNWELQAPLTSTALSSVEQLLVQQPSSPFYSGSITQDANDSLDTVKLRRWAYIKQRREQAEQSPVTVNGLTFDADTASTQKIAAAVVLAMIAKMASTQFSEEWTLSNNTSALLTGDDLINLGVALGTHVGSVYAIGRNLRTSIDSSTTIAAVNSVDWPA